jgi:hypothetical protein
VFPFAETLLEPLPGAAWTALLEVLAAFEPEAVTGPCVPERLTLVWSWFVALSQHCVFAALVVAEFDVPAPELLCAIAIPAPITTNAAAKTPVCREMRMGFSFTRPCWLPPLQRMPWPCVPEHFKRRSRGVDAGLPDKPRLRAVRDAVRFCDWETQAPVSRLSGQALCNARLSR